MPTEKRVEPLACLPAKYTDQNIRDLQSLASGVANEHQQKRVLDWIINNAARTYDLAYRPGEDGKRDTDFALGRAFVGQQIVKLLKLRPKT